MEKIQPFGDRVLLKVVEPEKKSEGGLILTSVSKETSNKGEVIAVGEGTTLPDGTIRPVSIKEGDIVLFTLGAGMEVKTAQETYKLVSARDIMCKVVVE